MHRAAFTTRCTAFFFLLLNIFTTHVVQARQSQFRLGHYRPVDYWVPSEDIRAQHVLQLQRKKGNATSQSYLQALRRGNQVDGVYGVGGLGTTEGGLVFVTNITLGSKTFTAVVDTGSSDTWVAETGFTCAAPGTGDILYAGACQFGPTYTKSKTFRPISNENFNVQYSDGESLAGTFGKEKVTVAGITVDNQQIALVNNAAWNGDGVSSGLLGLAFPADTRAFAGTNAALDSAATQKVYNPVFTNMYTEGHVAPLFSIALDRSDSGLLAIGGIPNIPFVPIFASSPLQILTTQAQDGSASASQYSFYTITTNGFQYTNATPDHWSYRNHPNPFGQPSDETQVQVIVDSGTTVIYLPTATADAINNLFKPPPFYKMDSGYYVVDCNATAPQFGVKIGFETFFVNPQDMIVNEQGQCISGIGAVGPGGTSVLGHPFLKNVLAVFDVGASQMRFAARLD